MTTKRIRRRPVPDIFLDKAFDVEHALSMYASSFVTMPASYIYNDEWLAQFKAQIRRCHIYIIGLVPNVDLAGVTQEGRDLITTMNVGVSQYDLHWKLPSGTSLHGDDTNGWYVEGATGSKSFPGEPAIAHRLSTEHDVFGFNVLYIGQAFGADGSRNSLDRLKKHETLQKIALKGTPAGYVLTVLMLAIESANQLVTIFNPWAQDRSQGSERITQGMNKLFNTNEPERTSLYEAALIRYFQPRFNKELKDSFPSTNMKLLADCYDKDFSAVVAEIYIDGLPFKLFSEVVKRTHHHIAKHDLHTDEARRVFFN